MIETTHPWECAATNIKSALFNSFSHFCNISVKNSTRSNTLPSFSKAIFWILTFDSFSLIKLFSTQYLITAFSASLANFKDVPFGAPIIGRIILVGKNPWTPIIKMSFIFFSGPAFWLITSAFNAWWRALRFELIELLINKLPIASLVIVIEFGSDESSCNWDGTDDADFIDFSSTLW